MIWSDLRNPIKEEEKALYDTFAMMHYVRTYVTDKIMWYCTVEKKYEISIKRISV